VAQLGPFRQGERDNVVVRIEEACRKVNFEGWIEEGDVLLVDVGGGLCYLRKEILGKVGERRRQNVMLSVLFWRLVDIGKMTGIVAEMSDLDRIWELRTEFHILICRWDKLDQEQSSEQITTGVDKPNSTSGHIE